ncbi:MAG: topoisomerase protein, partial [Parcubacteria group bacterium GW2011_GWA2_39_18]
KCGSLMLIKIGRFGKFLACSKYPDCKTTQPLVGSEEHQENLGNCPDCGHSLVAKRGRFGAFIACSNYPTCHFTQKNEKPTGIKCPKCESGDIVIKKSKRGKIFYACNKYPACDFSLWNKPTGEKCALCQSLMVEKGKKTLCSNSECPNSK